MKCVLSEGERGFCFSLEVHLRYIEGSLIAAWWLLWDSLDAPNNSSLQIRRSKFERNRNENRLSWWDNYSTPKVMLMEFGSVDSVRMMQFIRTSDDLDDGQIDPASNDHKLWFICFDEVAWTVLFFIDLQLRISQKSSDSKWLQTKLSWHL